MRLSTSAPRLQYYAGTGAGAAARPVQMHVERFNPAQRLYDRLGFHQIADKGIYLLLEWKPSTATSPARQSG